MVLSLSAVAYGRHYHTATELAPASAALRRRPAAAAPRPAPGPTPCNTMCPSARLRCPYGPLGRGKGIGLEDPVFAAAAAAEDGACARWPPPRAPR